MVKIEMVGYKIGRLTVVSEAYKYKSAYYWNCICECGNKTVVLGISLRRKREPTQSCGCLNAERTREVNTKHGLHGTRIASIHQDMKSRCTNPNNTYYYNYGGRGITLCDEWGSLAVFGEWALSHGYTEGLTIERLDVNKGYSPENCKWIPSSEQKFNKRYPARNTSGYPGVRFNKKYRNYAAALWHDGKSKHLGTYATFDEALVVRRDYELKVYGRYLFPHPNELKVGD